MKNWRSRLEAIYRHFRRDKGRVANRADGLEERRLEARITFNPGPQPVIYFHSQTLEIVLPEASTSYSNAPQLLLSAASFCDVVRKNNIPR